MQIKTKIYLLFLFLISQLHVGGQPLIAIDSFGYNPGNLKMFIHCNEQKQDTNLKPLVIVLHGCTQSASDVSKLTGWNKLADLNNFIVLYPQQKFVNNPNLCFNWFNNADINKGQGEAESIHQMIFFMRTHYLIDSNKIFITGLSAGAAMSVVMMAVHPQSFKCGAIFAGGAYKIATNPIASLKALAGKKYIPKEELIKNIVEQNPTYKGTYPALIIYQGLNDPVVNHKNSTLLINQWAGINNCDTIADKTDNSYMNIADITRMEYNDTLGRTVIIAYEINNLGHRLMVKPGNNYNEGGQTGIFGINKNFHSTFQTASEFGIIKK